jgi:hypothetical protein
VQLPGNIQLPPEEPLLKKHFAANEELLFEPDMEKTRPDGSRIITDTTDTEDSTCP